MGLHRDTVRKMLTYSVPPGYRRESALRRPKLEPFTGVIDAILEGDTRVPRKAPTIPTTCSGLPNWNSLTDTSAWCSAASAPRTSPP